MASNLNPKTSGYTTTGVILSAEPFPSVVEAALANNTGFNLYRPIRGHQYDRTGTFSGGGAGTTIEVADYVYLASGVYDVEVRVTGTAVNAGTIWLMAGGTRVSAYMPLNNAGSTFISQYNGATIEQGWHSLYVYTYVAGALDNTFINNVDTFFRQYA